jgi:nucleotide-binding universal stress UspA family protein
VNQQRSERRGREGGPHAACGPGTRIVVGVDGSATAQEALRWAIALGDTLGVAIVAVHALGTLDRWHDPDASARSWRRSVSDLIERTWCAPLGRATSPHRVEVREGHPVDVLSTATAVEDAGLLVVGSRGMRSDPARALGSTSLQVLQWAQVPVLVVPAGRPQSDLSDSLALRRLLVGVDGLPPSLAALALAAEVAERLGGSLNVLHVFTPAGGVARDRSGRALGRTMTLVGAELRAIRDRGIGAHTVVRSGDPASTLVEVADDVDADLVVVGSRGHGGQGELLLGSVARTVADRVRRPTLVVPAAAGRVHLPGPRGQPTMAEATTK